MRNLLRNLAYASVIVAATVVTVAQFQRPAQAQAAGRTLAAIATGGNAIATDGTVYEYTPTPGGGEVWTQIGRLTHLISPPVAMYSAGTVQKVACQNGDIFSWNPLYPSTADGLWMGNIFGASGPVNVEPTTWSRVKAGVR